MEMDQREENIISWNVMRITIGTGQSRSVAVTIGSVSPAITECDLWHVRYAWDILVFQNEQKGELKKKKKWQKGKTPAPDLGQILKLWLQKDTFLLFMLVSWLGFHSKNTWIDTKNLQNILSNLDFTIDLNNSPY